jgi:tripeptide aminopeptidase
MTTLEILKENPDIPHGEIKAAFTPDEKTDHGADHFYMETFSFVHVILPVI